MPDRIVRHAAILSSRVDQLDAGPAEVFYRRMINVVDDFGRFDGRVTVIKAACYPLRLHCTRDADISRWLAACEKAGLIVTYEVDGKPYLELLNLGEPRAKRSKYPPPPPHAYASKPVQTQEDVPPFAFRLSHSSSDSNTPAPADELPTFPVFPTVGGKRTKDKTWTLPDALVTQLSESFPGVDVPHCCREAHLWTSTNPAKRKTAAGMPEFLRRWMQKEQDRTGRTGGTYETPDQRARRLAKSNGAHHGIN